MNQNRWKTVNRIFHDALEVPSGERQSFVQAASGGDPDIQAEVEVLLKADEDAGSYLESPIIDQDFIANSLPPVQPGDVLCQRFRIVRAVGEGGMGHVFEAYDSELAVRVALKVVRSEIASNPAALARFRQEVRLARRITHPNVCRTFDIERDVRIVHAEHGTTQEVVFLTMEFLEGETLASRIKQRGPVPLSEAQETARQIAGALGAAHELGIIHRDMKPANIMLVPTKPGDAPGFRAVITDFGLARLDPVFSSGNLSALSHTARPIGTLAYMAPEQLENGPVSPATDIYALGLVLFEMVTGTRAFPSENLLSGIAQRLAGPPPSPQKLVPGLPQPWCRAIEGCLRTKPEERFQSAADVMAVLDGGKVRLPAARRRSFLSSLPPRRRMMALVAILVAAVALFAGTFRLYQTKADAKVAPGALIYLTQVKNQTGEKALDNVTELIHAGLAQSVQLNLLDTSRVGDILQQMTKPPDATIDAPTAREIAMRAGAVRVVFATVSGAGGNYKIDVDIEQPDNTPARYRNHWTRSFAWHSAPAAANGTIAPELLTAVRTASDWIRHEAGESANDIARLDVPPEDVTTSSWQALAQFAQGEKFVSALNYEQAIESFQSAAQTDPDFALAYGRLGDVLLQVDRVADGYAAYNRALRVASEERLSLRERDRIKGYAALDMWNDQGAVAAFRDYLLYYPNDYEAHCYLAYALEGLGQIEEAIAELKEAYAIDPTRAAAPEHLALFYVLLGNVDSSRQWNTAVEKTGGEDHLAYNIGVQEFLEGRYSESRDAFVAMTRSKGPMVRSVAYTYLTRLAVEEGDLPDAMTWVRAGLNEDLASGDKTLQAARYMDEAAINCERGQFEACLNAVDKALELDRSPQLTLSAAEILGSASAEAPRTVATRIRDALDKLGRDARANDGNTAEQVAEFRTEGEALLAGGETTRALDAFRRAAAIEPAFLNQTPRVRAAMAAASHAKDPQEARRLWEEAWEACASDLAQPGAHWQWGRTQPPGTFSNELQEFLQIAERLGIDDTSVRQARDTLSRLRKNIQQMTSSLDEARPSRVASPPMTGGEYGI